MGWGGETHIKNKSTNQSVTFVWEELTTETMCRPLICEQEVLGWPCTKANIYTLSSSGRPLPVHFAAVQYKEYTTENESRWIN